MRRLTLALGFVLGLVFGAQAPSARAQSTSAYGRVLAAHARAGGMDYASLAGDARARADLDAYVASLASMPDSAGLADWLNAYNAIVVHRIVHAWPIASVRDVPGFFDRTRVRVAGVERTLDDLENGVIRPRFHDARVHVALNCGAVSCPPLEPRPFEARTLEATLDRLARAAVQNDAMVRVRDGSLELSEIFFWFEADFRRDAGSVLQWLRRYDATGRLRNLAASATPRRIPYRWAINHHAR